MQQIRLEPSFLLAGSHPACRICFLLVGNKLVVYKLPFVQWPSSVSTWIAFTVCSTSHGSVGVSYTHTHTHRGRGSNPPSDRGGSLRLLCLLWLETPNLTNWSLVTEGPWHVARVWDVQICGPVTWLASSHSTRWFKAVAPILFLWEGQNKNLSKGCGPNAII